MYTIKAQLSSLKNRNSQGRSVERECASVGLRSFRARAYFIRLIHFLKEQKLEFYLLRIKRLTGALVVMLSIVGCRRQESFESFLSDEIAKYGGNTNSLIFTNCQTAIWRVESDALGSLITAREVDFTSVSNSLAAAYKQPRLYLPATGKKGPTYVFPASEGGVAIFISSTGIEIEINIMKPIK